LIWKPVLKWGMGIALASVFLLTLNNLPMQLASASLLQEYGLPQGQIVPKTSPEWLSYTYLNGSIPWLGLAVSRSTNILFYPAFFMILFYSSHYLTNAWTKMQWRGILIFFIAGLGVMTLTFENYSTWIISGVIVAVFLWAAYYFFLIKKYTHEYD
jgi:hypothetical protein